MRIVIFNRSFVLFHVAVPMFCNQGFDIVVNLQFYLEEGFVGDRALLVTGEIYILNDWSLC